MDFQQLDSMGRDAMQTVRGAVVLWFPVAARRCRPFAAGLLLSVFLIAAWSQALTALGTSAPILTGLITSIGLSVAVSLWARRALTGVLPAGAPWLLLPLWSQLIPAAGATLPDCLSWVPLDGLAMPAVECFIGLVGGLLLLGPTCILATLLAAAAEDPSRAHAATTPSLTGLAAGLMAWPTIVLPVWGDLQSLTLGGAILSAGPGLTQWWSSRRSAHMVRSTSSSDANSPSHRSSRLDAETIAAWLQAGVAGGLLAVALRVQAQLWLTGLYCHFSLAAGCLLGVVAERRALSRRDRAGRQLWGRGVACAAALLLLAGFPLLTDASLWINGHMTTTVLILGCRASLCALLAFPAGVVYGLSATGSTSRQPRSASDAAVRVLSLTGGFVSISWSLPSIETASLALLAAAGAMALQGVIDLWQSGRATRRTNLALAGSLVLATALFLARDPCDVSRSARLLFSARSALAAKSAEDRELLEALDDSRLLESREGRSAAWTAWKQRGGLLVLRQNGMPVGSRSLEPTLLPEPGVDVMAAAAPLGVHPHPNDVLVVGLGGSAAVSTCLEFPVRSVTCLEEDADLLQLVSRHAKGPVAGSTLDPRLTTRNVSPVLASASRDLGSFDVIVINQPQPAALGNVALFTAESYRRWSRHLAPRGILCQRLNFADFGDEPLRAVARTLCAAFPQVVLWESAPGELLFLASNDEAPIITEQLLTRFEAPHVRRVLAGIAWDWSLPLSLVAVKPETLAGEFSAPSRVNDVSTGLLACRLPGEVARWGAKWQEVRELLRPCATPLLTWFPSSPETEVVQKRLADVAEQRTLINEHPDHFWAYRKSLRDRLQNRPRTRIIQVKHEGMKRETDPEDDRRQKYLAALGDAATDEHPSAADLQRVAAFAAPYDPLVAPFVSGEVARLYARSEPKDATAEWTHWMRSVYFAPDFDRSVRGAVAALNLLLDEEYLLADPEQRWDHADALLEVLKQRWIARGQIATGSRFDPIDARETIDAAGRAIEMLKTSAAAAGIDSRWCDARCQVLERTLVRPLRKLQTQQTARIEALDRHSAAAADTSSTK